MIASLTQKLGHIGQQAHKVVQAQNDRRIQLLSTFDKKDSELKSKITSLQKTLEAAQSQLEERNNQH